MSEHSEMKRLMALFETAQVVESGDAYHDDAYNTPEMQQAIDAFAAIYVKLDVAAARADQENDPEIILPETAEDAMYGVYESMKHLEGTFRRLYEAIHKQYLAALGK